MQIKFRKIFVLTAIMLINGCQTSPYSIENKPNESPLSLAIVSPSDLEGEGEILGETPQQVEQEKIHGKILKVKSKNGRTKYIFFPSPHLKDNKITVSEKFFDTDESQDKNQTHQFNDKNTRNELNRLLLKSYQALTGNKTSTAKDLALKAAEFDSEIAAPHIILGLIALREGKSSEAKSAFEKAKSLDPQDGEIERLIELAQ